MTAELPFEHPAVQRILAVNTQEAVESGINEAFSDALNRDIYLNKTAQSQDGRSRQAMIDHLRLGLRAEHPFAGLEEVGQYDIPERAVFLVKVNKLGYVATGTLTRVATLWVDSDVPLQSEPLFPEPYREIVLRMIKRQKEVGWQPKILSIR